MVFGEIFVWVARGVGSFLVSSFCFVAGKLAAVGYGYVFGGLVTALGGKVLDFADDGFTVQDFAEDDVLAVEVGGWDGSDEELGAIGAYVLELANSNLTF